MAFVIEYVEGKITQKNKQSDPPIWKNNQ